MKPASVGFYARLASDVTDLCRLWVIEPKNRGPIFMTDHDVPVMYEDVEYIPTHSFECSAIGNTIGGSNISFDVRVLLGEEISRADVERGMMDGSPMSISAIFYEHTDLGTMPLAQGFVTSVSLPGQSVAVLTCAGDITSTKQVLTEQYSPMCRADFCDTRCRLDIGLFSTAFAITSLDGPLTFGTDLAGDYANDYWSLGTVSWVDGLNAGTRTEVYRSTAAGGVRLLIRPAYPFVIGDQGSIARGCDKRIVTCRAYDNELNFRGEPFVPGADMMNAPIFSIPSPEASSDIPEADDD